MTGIAIRRGFLRLLGGAALGAGAARAAADAGPKPPGAALPASPVGELIAWNESPERRAARRALDAASHEGTRANRRQRHARALLGGYPPQVASMHACAPWFRAMVAARIIEAEEHSHEEWHEQLRRYFLGDS